MASNRSVIVLTPNGRRQTVKVSPNTTILQVIEEVCKKHGYNPEEYDIRHHKKTLDTNSTMGFSGLPNNAQLELFETDKTRQESEVTIGLHLENGSRILGTFRPNNTIYEILNHLKPEELEPSKNSVIIYMRREIYGLEQFKVTDLKSLGLTSGRAMLRLIHRSPEELKTQANISAPLPAKPVEEKPYMRKLQKIESPVYQPAEIPSKEPTPPPSEKNEDLSNKVNNENLKRPVAQKTNIIDIIKSEKKKQKCMKKPEPMEVDKPPTVTNENIEKDFFFLGARNAMLFSLETAQSIPSEELPDDFFELTIDDAKKLLRDIKRRQVELENRPLMTSNLRELEESKKQLRQLSSYTKTIIRIQFPDRTVLQGTFSTADDVRAVINFVREYLENQQLDFYLYTTPPKQILDENSRLIEIGCVPGAILHFGTNVTECQNKTVLRTDLRDKFTTSSTASMAAAKLREKSTRVQHSMDEDDVDVDLLASNNDINVDASTSAYVDYDKPSTSKQEQENVPKWFKAGK